MFPFKPLTLATLVAFGFGATAYSQNLEYVPPVIPLKPVTDTALSFVVTTASDARDRGVQEKKPYMNTVQIVDADQPWPPRWYAATPLYTDSMFEKDNRENMYRFNYIIDAKVEGKYFSFYKILSRQSKGVGQLIAPQFAGYIMLNEKMEPVDTALSTAKRRNLYYHDFRINANGERLVDLRKDTYLDLRDYTDQDKDSVVHCNIDYIQILDSNNAIIFSWNPIEHIPADLFRFKETLKDRAFGARNSGLIEWTRLTSAVWDYDGNILYAMKKIGIGKISRADGHLMWHIDFKDIPMGKGKDALQWYHPHDFNFLYETDSSVVYSLYSNGIESGTLACGVIFEQNKKTQQFKLLKYIMPYRKYVANGQGNVDYRKDGSYVIGYGSFEEPDSAKSDFWSTFEYGKDDEVYGVYQFPRWNQCYKAHKLENWPRTPRPLIVKSRDLLEATGPMTDWTWYRLEGADQTTVTQVGVGSVFKPVKGATYCVQGKYGMGFSVSRPFKVK